MSRENPSSSLEPSSGPELQFEQAEYDEAAPSLACKACGQSISGEYFLVNGEYFCSSCRWAREGPIEPERSSVGRFLRAALYGAGAAAVGTLIYFGISWATGYEFGLIAIIVGWMVGKAVSSGSGNRGGRVYQALAVFLTYCSIVSSYVPSVMTGLAEASKQDQTEQTAAGGASGSALEGTAAEPANADVEASPPAESQPEEAAAPVSDPSAPTMAAGLALYLLVVGVIAFLAPFLAGWENIFGLVIIGIGLYEAWKHSARQYDSIEGPFTAGSPPATAATAGTI